MPYFSIPISDERLSDVLCAALEGGSNYWYRIIKSIGPVSWTFESDPPPSQGHHYAQDYPLNTGGALIIIDTTEGNAHGKMRLDQDTVMRGLAVLAEKYTHHLADILAQNEDAITGDALLQCALFGDIIYG